VQATPVLFNIEKSVDLVISWIERAGSEGCDLLLFPESFIPGYPRGLSFDAVIGKRTHKGRLAWLDFWCNSLVVTSAYTDRISEAIKKTGLFVALGVTEREPRGGSLYCTLLYFDKNGTLARKHRKLKPTGLERYMWAESDGSTLLSFNTNIGKIGGLICWENYMPLARTAMYQKGVEIYLAPTADARESWQSTMQNAVFKLLSHRFLSGSAKRSRRNPSLPVAFTKTNHHSA
jgi:nitrilase